MATRRGGFQPRSRRIVDWGVGPATADQAISASGTTLWNTGTVPSMNLTLMRTRGLFSIRVLTAAAAGDGFFGAAGIFMATEDAFNQGAVAMLDPLSDSNSDMWIWHSFFDVRAITATIADGVNAVSVIHRIVIDSKAMRKDFDPERRMVGVTEVAESGAATADINAEVRQLFKQ